MTTSEEQQTEPQVPSQTLSPVGKLFFASLIGWIMNGTKFNWKLKGEPAIVQAMAKAAIASKEFQDEYKRPGATVDTVMEKLNAKAAAAAEYEKLSGQKWPL